MLILLLLLFFFCLGAGKSTLLDVLAGRKTSGRTEGEILLNGEAFNPITFNHLAGYVEQFDTHNALSTVREAIEFSARLRLPNLISNQNEEINKKVDEMLDILELRPFADSLIGPPGLNAEVRKKLSLAVEMIMEPSLLFVDESD